ncbi:MAG: hypothetical protein OEY20_14290, partial [Gemmatimonadota bacterium]|nr:hypothetical protein [Gemmatimonadota bacterium]
MTSHHLVAVWNPAYAANAMEAHLSVLLSRVRDWREQKGDEEGIYVWWGKIRSENRQQRLKRDAELRAIAVELAEDETRELQLYLTDYRSLYVGRVDGISWEDVRTTDLEHTPTYYRDSGRECDCWFELGDIRRLVADDTIAVVEELRLLRNVHYNERPVSLYGGMVDLPLVVTRPDARRFFDDDACAVLPEGQLWVEFDAESGGLGLMQRDLRENLFGDAVWLSLEPVSRTFVATAEKVFRDHRGDESLDFQAVLGPLSKAVEVEVNARLRQALKTAPDAARRANVDGQTVDLRSGRPLSLGQLARAIGGERALNDYLTRSLENGGWFAGQLPAILDALADDRNPGSHAARIPRDTARQWREQIVGVGCEGVLAALAKCRVKG